MNLILGNLTTLKQWLLPDSWQSQTARDAVIASLGLGIAGVFETFCDRRFARAVGDTEIFSGETTAFVLRRYPLESLPTFEVKHAGETAWTATADLLSSWRADNGLIQLAAPAGDSQTQLRVTFTGGYWIDETEDSESPGDDDEPLEDAQPAGSFLLPGELERAWLEQCRHVWTANKLFANTGENSDKIKPPEMALLPLVKSVLQQYRRISL